MYLTLYLRILLDVKTSIIIQTTSKTCCIILHDGLYLQLSDRYLHYHAGKNALARRERVESRHVFIVEMFIIIVVTVESVVVY